jgi:hypothetical protein
MRNRTTLALAAVLAAAAPALAQIPAEQLLTPPSPPTMAPAPVRPGYLPSFLDGEPPPVPQGRFWASAEYLFAWVKGDTPPAFVTTSPAGTPQALAGIPQSATTSSLFGGTMNNDLRSGFRFGTGYWFGAQQVYGVEAGVMLVESQAHSFGASSPGTPILARPFFNAATGAPASVLVAFPGVSSGALSVRDRSGNFIGTNIDLVQRLYDVGWLRFVPMLGYRFFRYDEGVHFRQSIAPTGGAFAPGTSIVSTDDFTTQNEFHGGDFGMRTMFFWQNWSLNVLTKVAVGQVHSDVNITGSQVTTTPGAAPAVLPGGVYALPSNIGSHGIETWTFIPELGLNFGWQVRPNLRLGLGYTLLFLDDIARASSQVNQTINPGLFPPAVTPLTGPASPTALNKTQDVYIQALSFAMTFNY